jgi:5-methylcytosine-specific restriction protein B
VYDERYHGQKHFKGRYQARSTFRRRMTRLPTLAGSPQRTQHQAPYQGTSFVWFPGPTGSVVVLVIGTDGFGADTHILGRPGHARRLRALKRLNGGRLWVKPDLLDLGASVPAVITTKWPDISAAVRAYERVIYAAVAVNDHGAADLVSDLLDLFFDEHGTPLTGNAKARWEKRRAEIRGAVFPGVLR